LPPEPRLGDADKPITDKELGTLLASLRGVYSARGFRARTIIQTLALTGLRASELGALRIADVVLDKKAPHLRVRGGKRRRPNQVDTIPISQELADLLQHWIARVKPDANGNLFCSERGIQLSRGRVWAIVKGAMRRAGLRACLNVHSFRHYYCTQVAAQTKDPYVAARLMRHKNIAHVMRYYHGAGADDVARKLRLPRAPR
jgi:integrase/recombinase XerD